MTEKNRWIPVEEKLPNELTRYQVAVRYKDDGTVIVTEALFHGDGWCDGTCDDLLGGKVVVTHWQPLTQPPNALNKETYNSNL